MRSVLRVAVALVVSSLLAGCVQMPTSGPVVEPEVSTGTEDVPGISFDPRPPQEGQAPADIVAGFLEAMKATPISLTVARQFLSREAAETWGPEKQILTFAELGDPSAGTDVRIPLTDVNRYDARGAWQRTEDTAVLRLGLVQEDGQWRIDDLPDALIVPDSWFDDWYERASLYYFDPTATVLVPEPVYVPRGDQFASTLVRGLVTVLPAAAAEVTRTYFPAGTTLGLLPIESGIARVALSGDPDAVDDETTTRMLTQLAWTLGQEPRVDAVELSVGGRTLSGPGGLAPVNLSFGASYDPNGDGPSQDLFALQQGRVVRGSTVGDLRSTLGPLGRVGAGLRSIGVSVDGSRVAGVSADGTSVVSAPTEAPAEVVTVVDGATDLGAPLWDVRGRTWVLDRGNGSARVMVVTDGVAAALTVPGVTGRRVTKLLVSRDGTRLVAVLRGRKADTVVSARIRQNVDGAVTGFTPVVTLPVQLEGDGRIRDVAWRSPTTVSVLSDITPLSQSVRTLSVDGAPGAIDTTGTSRLRGPNRVLVSSPLGGEAYAIAGRVVTSINRPERTVPDLPAGLTSLTYVG